MKKRLLSILLALALVFSVLPQLALAADATGSCGANLSWSFVEATGALTITGSGAMTDYEWSGNPDWQEFRTQVKSVSLPAGLTRIGNCAFIRFPIEGSVVIPEGVTAIGDGAFEDCDMTAVTIPDSVKTIGYGAFCSCDNLTELRIPAGLTAIGEENFAACTGLTSVVIPDNITAIGSRAFQGSTNLKSVVIPDTVTVIGDNAFCRTGLESVTVGAKVTTVGYKAFAECPALPAIEVDPANPNYSSDGGVLYNKARTQLLQCPGGKTGAYALPASVTSINSASFENCALLTELTIAAPVTAIGSDAFRGCAGLSELTLPGSLKTIGWTAFYGCSGFEQIRIPESVTLIEADAFDACTGLKAIKIMNKNVEIGDANYTLGVPGTTIVFGHPGSTAQTYARNYGYTFKELSQEDDPCALGHDFGEWTKTADPTCTEDGARSRTCSRCDLIDVEPIPALGHDFDDGVVTVKPTATTPGVRTFTCRRCGETTTKRIPRTGSTLPDDIDFTDASSADQYAVIGRTNAQQTADGLVLRTTRNAVEDCNGQNSGAQATTPEDLLEIAVDGDWTATLEFVFDPSANNGYYQFFGFYAAQGDDYQNMAGIRGGDGALQNFLRVGGAITADSADLNSSPGLASAGTYFFRIEKEADTYICYRSADGAEFTEMFRYEGTGIEAEKLIIDAYTGMTEGYTFTLKALTFEGGAAPAGNADIDFTDPADADKYEIDGQTDAAPVEGVGLTLVSTMKAIEYAGTHYQDGYEMLQGDDANTPVDIVKVPVTGDWTATLDFAFDQASSRGYYEFFGFYAMEGEDYQNLVGIRGADGDIQDFLRQDGSIMAATKSATIGDTGLPAATEHWFRIQKTGDSYVCSGSTDGENYSEFFSFDATGIEADYLMIDAYSSMEQGYTYTLKSLSFEEGEIPPPPVVDKTALQKAIQDYEFITTTNYTPESVDAFQSAVAAGRTIRDNPAATQAEVDAATQAILDAYAALVPLPGHEHSYTAVVTAPTCTEAGYTTYTCECGDSYVADETAPLGHDFGEWSSTKEATCTEKGEEARACSRCDVKETRQTDALGHDLTTHEGKAATCTEGGWAAYETCSRCDYTTYRELPALGHDLTAHVAKAPTCTEVGWNSYETCSRCDYTTYAEEPALGHSFGDWAVSKAATCTEKGEETRACIRCDVKETRELDKIAHDYKDGKCTVCGEADPDYKPPVVDPFRFDDVKDAGKFYYEPVYWAYEHEPQITKGTSEKLFSPDAGCTRGQVVTFLWRAMNEPEPESTRNPFEDVKTGAYYYKAVLWAVEKGITKGTSDTTFRPDQTCTRGQIVTFLYRAKNQPELKDKTNPFKDVAESAYYYDAVLWAAENEITKGKTANTFAPDATCTRGEIVTFLYRAEAGKEE